MRWIWIVIFLMQAVAAGAWWWLMPGDFPVGDLHFWSNQVLPWLVIAVAVAGIVAAWRNSSLLAQLSLVPGLFCCIAAVTFHFVFLYSGIGRWEKLLGLGALFLLLSWLARRPNNWKRRARPAESGSALAWAWLAAAGAGIVLPLAQYAPEPSTRPLNPEVELSGTFDMPQKKPDDSGVLRLSPTVMVSPDSEGISVHAGPLQVVIEPLLTFVSRSPDRCWTSFAPEWLRTRRDRKLTMASLSNSRATIFYENADGEAALACDATFPEGTAIDARSTIDAAVFSHLNSFCLVSVAGQSKTLSLEFSPCPGKRIDVLPADYPFGRPARFAYLDAAQVFHIVEASSGEKGPFTELASGPLTEGKPLAITIYEGSDARCTLEFDDWARQASFALSPTAGWGVPVNAVEFRREGDQPESTVNLFFTLAGTSVGRGWDSVGHAAGTYRNRMRIITMPDTRPQDPKP